MSDRIVPFLPSYVFSSPRGNNPVRFVSFATGTSPQLETYIPGVGPQGMPRIVHVDYVGGNNSTVTTLDETIVNPYGTFAAAWAATVTAANASPNEHFVVQLHNVSYGNTIGETSISTFPTANNITIRGEGITQTVFANGSDYLNFFLGADAGVILRFEHMTLPHLAIYRSGGVAPGAQGNSFAQGLQILGNGTTGIISSITITAGTGGQGAATADYNDAGDGGVGGDIKGVVIDGFVAVSSAYAAVFLQAGSGGTGGTAGVYFTGEYGDMEAYGSPGNGGANGIVTHCRISNMTSIGALGAGGTVNIGGWNLNLKPGNPGTGGVYQGGSQDGIASGTPGEQQSPSGVLQTVVVMDSNVMSVASGTDILDTPGYCDLKLIRCQVGMYNGSDTYLIAHNLVAIWCLMNPSIIATVTATNDVSNSLTQSLDI